MVQNVLGRSEKFMLYIMNGLTKSLVKSRLCSRNKNLFHPEPLGFVPFQLKQNFQICYLSLSIEFTPIIIDFFILLI